MVLGIVWVYWIGSILALIFGYIALNQIKRTGQNGRAMAIAGIVLGWIGVGLLLAVIALGVLGASSSSQYKRPAGDVPAQLPAHHRSTASAQPARTGPGPVQVEWSAGPGHTHDEPP